MELYEVAIIGGGLAGLTNAILLAKAGKKVILFEKNQYPFHRVCGEYISNETLPFLESLGVDIIQQKSISLTQFRLTSPKGTTLEMPLDLGGFGISRYELDFFLMELAKKNGVTILEKTNITSIKEKNNTFFLTSNAHQKYQANILIAAYGKRANLDQYLRRDFFYKRSAYIGVKYHLKVNHLKYEHPKEMIALHNFSYGYGGFSRIEDDKYCFCYLSTRENLKKSGDILSLEKNILSKNPYIKDIFENSYFLFDKPKVINEITFAPKTLFEGNILMCGDTAGMITPLCGNGMAMAIHSAKILSENIILHLDKKISFEQCKQNYLSEWNKNFKQRLKIGRNIQRFFGSPFLSEVLVKSANLFPFIKKILVKQSHGKVF
ncbi:MAG: NAD(P)/FAD-dependent oxidoreductase [Bacteroidetes bacterium]|nr:MAG: NAD(P)/FAD-dependent oxidoreductase [Bacteroidota bacterium]TAG87027.1 MAG: NAD(P)/FAD-dependent oxidoreductase [Bacteroidota bacterium]